MELQGFRYSQEKLQDATIQFSLSKTTKTPYLQNNSFSILRTGFIMGHITAPSLSLTHATSHPFNLYRYQYPFGVAGASLSSLKIIKLLFAFQSSFLSYFFIGGYWLLWFSDWDKRLTEDNGLWNKKNNITIERYRKVALIPFWNLKRKETSHRKLVVSGQNERKKEKEVHRGIGYI